MGTAPGQSPLGALTSCSCSFQEPRWGSLRTSDEGAAGDVALLAPSTLGKALELSVHRQVARWKCHLLSRVLHILQGCSPELPALTCLN